MKRTKGHGTQRAQPLGEMVQLVADSGARGQSTAICMTHAQKDIGSTSLGDIALSDHPLDGSGVHHQTA